jgi:hypothetical protein
MDPVMKISGWKDAYRQAAILAKQEIGPLWSRLVNVSVGAFRAPTGHFKRMEKLRRNSEIFAWPMSEDEVVSDGKIQKAMRYADEDHIIDYVQGLLN